MLSDPLWICVDDGEGKNWGGVIVLNSHLLYAMHFDTVYHIEFYHPIQDKFIWQTKKGELGIWYLASDHLLDRGEV